MSSSFVAKIMEHAVKLEQKTFHDKLDVLTMKLSEMEVEMFQLAESKYVHFHPNFLTGQSLIQKVHDVQDEMATIEKTWNTQVKGQLSLSTGEFHNLNQELSAAKTVHAGLAYLADIYELLETSARSLESKKYSQAAVTLLKLEAYMKQPLIEQNDKITILAAMKTEFRIRFATLECNLSDLWHDLLKWTVKTSPESSNGAATLNEISISVTCNGSDSSELDELVEGLYISNLLSGKMKAFANMFQEHVIPLILDNVHLNITLKTLKQTKTLSIRCHDVQSSDTSQESAKNYPTGEKMYIHIFGNLMNILDYLQKLFLHVEYGRNEATTMLDVSSASETNSTSSSFSKGTLMSLLGQSVSSWLLDLLQKTVLAKAIPSSAKDLAGFSEVIGVTQLLQDQLLKLRFIQPDNTVLMQYVQNINILFANKKSQTTLEKAHSLMTSDLHDTVAVAEDKPIGEWPPLTRGGVKKSQRLDSAVEHQLSDNTLRMPKCRISENIQTLMMLAYETLCEATESSPECATQMFYAVRNMFELFYHVVPTYHSQNFEAFPQIAALHHNNCMFIAHHLLTLSHQFAPKLPSPDNKTFVDLIEKIRRSGVEVFLAQLNRQRSLLLEYLGGADGFGRMEEESSREKAEKAVKQVTLQLGHLQKIWKPVLPINIYKKAMGKLIQAVVGSISDSISSLEDIAQEATHRLDVLLVLIEQTAGEMLTSPGEVAAAELLRHVPDWARLTEVKFMLAASLSEIADRWAEGTGPLALSFTPMEVKQMIRALFQNTDRRANLLVAIK
uniref:Centromere/kinetochore protein zw10 homolog n=1 Tax=Arion vulgaris TaxID=1028688 RepID=A0A0B7BFU7_9EUPU